MRILDYIALGVLIVLITWAVADWFPRATDRTSLRSDLIRAAQFAIGEGLRTEFQTPHEASDQNRGIGSSVRLEPVRFSPPASLRSISGSLALLAAM
jgi:hypothetical protein